MDSETGVGERKGRAGGYNAKGEGGGREKEGIMRLKEDTQTQRD